MSAPATEPALELIAEAYEDLLLGISPGAGYYNNIGERNIVPVLPDIGELATQTIFPLLCVETSTETLVGGDVTKWRARPIAVVWAYVRDKNIRRAKHRLIDDIRRAGTSSLQFGGAAVQSEWLGNDSDEGLLAVNHGVALFAVRFAVEYDWR